MLKLNSYPNNRLSMVVKLKKQLEPRIYTKPIPTSFIKIFLELYNILDKESNFFMQIRAYAYLKKYFLI